jgi:hypothetical protein
MQNQYSRIILIWNIAISGFGADRRARGEQLAGIAEIAIPALQNRRQTLRLPMPGAQLFDALPSARVYRHLEQLGHQRMMWLLHTIYFQAPANAVHDRAIKQQLGRQLHLTKIVQRAEGFKIAGE